MANLLRPRPFAFEIASELRFVDFVRPFVCGRKIYLAGQQTTRKKKPPVGEKIYIKLYCVVLFLPVKSETKKGSVPGAAYRKKGARNGQLKNTRGRQKNTKPKKKSPPTCCCKTLRQFSGFPWLIKEKALTTITVFLSLALFFCAVYLF